MRLPYADNPPRLSDPSHQAFVDKLVKNRGKRGLSPLDLSLLHSPPFARGFLQFFTAIRGKSTLPEDVMELAMCRVGALNGAAFEWMHHAPLLHAAGVSAQGVETVRTAKVGRMGREGEGGLSLTQWKVMRVVDEMTKSVKVKDGTFDALRGVLNERQIVELGEFCPLIQCICIATSFCKLWCIYVLVLLLTINNSLNSSGLQCRLSLPPRPRRCRDERCQGRRRKAARLQTLVPFAFFSH
jgi:alkylhydroperoxidase family enzyme